MRLLSRKDLIVDREDVMVFGVYSILTKNSDLAIERGKEIDNMISHETLRGSDVLTVGETRVGKIQDLILDNEVHIIGFELGRIYVEGSIADRDTIAGEAQLEIQPLGESLIFDFGTT